MATVESNGSITVMKYNDFANDLVNISIRDSSDNEVLIMHKDVEFLNKVISGWLKESKE